MFRRKKAKGRIPFLRFTEIFFVKLLFERIKEVIEKVRDALLGFLYGDFIMLKSEEFCPIAVNPSQNYPGQFSRKRSRG